MKERYSFSSVNCLVSSDGSLITSQQGITAEILAHFKSILASVDSAKGLNCNFVSFGKVLSEEYQSFLVVDFTLQKVKDVVFSMAPLKARPRWFPCVFLPKA